MSTITRQRVKEAGMVSILVTMLMMIVVSLIVLGFAQISRRNQRQSLDRQLSTQAFYAAETGVNDTRNLIQNAITTGQTVPEKEDCTNGAGATAAFYGLLPNPTLDAANKTSYTCLIVDPTPRDLVYSNVNRTSTIAPINAPSAIARLEINWQSKQDTTTPTVGCAGASLTTVFSPYNSWTCGFGVLRVDLVPTAGNQTAQTLLDNTMTTFLVPRNAGGISTIPWAAGTANTNNRVGVLCYDTDRRCQMSITGLTGSQYYIRVTSLYKDSGLRIVAYNASNVALELANAQALVDSTGKAQDVLRRIQVRLPLTPSSTNRLSDYGLQSTDSICKRFGVMDGFYQNYAPTAVAGLTSITSPPNPFCI